VKLPLHTAQAWANVPRRTRSLPLRLMPTRLAVSRTTRHRLGASAPTRFHLGVPLLPGRPWGSSRPPPHPNGTTGRPHRLDAGCRRLPEETFTIRAGSRQTMSPQLGAAPASVAACDISASLPKVCWPGSLVTPDRREVGPLSRGVILSCDATPVRTITARPSLPPSSSTCCPVGAPCGVFSPPPWCTRRGGQQAYHVPPMHRSG